MRKQYLSFLVLMFAPLLFALSASKAHAMTGQEAVYKAEEYLNVTWQPNLGSACGGNYNLYSANTTYSGMAYAFGKWDTPSEFQQKASTGVQTGYSNLSNCSTGAGIDCSGLISRAWGLSSHRDSNAILNDRGLTSILGSYNDLKPGDALARNGHVMLFEKKEPDGRYTVIEATSVGYKVRRYTYSSTELSNGGYQPRRYNDIKESPTPKSNKDKKYWGDFNGDGKSDMIIVEPSGSYWYLSNGDGTWTQSYSRDDLKYGTVEFKLADFDGNGMTDFIFTTNNGSFWYFSTGGYNWIQKYVRTDLKLGSVQYVIGNFNGAQDNYSDIIITTPGGSYWYFSNGTGTSWNQKYERTDLRLGLVDYRIGDFDGNENDDMIIINPSGSFWYFSNGTGSSWDQRFMRGDLQLGAVDYYVGDFDGNSDDDMIIVTPSGSFWYYSNGIGNSWNQKYDRSDLRLGIVDYKIGDFDGNYKDDMIVVNPNGSYWYMANDINFTQGIEKPNQKLGAVDYRVGHFDGQANIRADFIMIDSSGSYVQMMNQSGTWEIKTTFDHLKLGSVDFKTQ